MVTINNPMLATKYLVFALPTFTTECLGALGVCYKVLGGIWWHHIVILCDATMSVQKNLLTLRLIQNSLKSV